MYNMYKIYFVYNIIEKFSSKSISQLTKNVKPKNKIFKCLKTTKK